MVLDNIEKLLEKYESAETTVQEEQQLKNYFSQETVAPHLEVYKPMFTYFLHAQNDSTSRELPLKPEKTNSLYQWIAIAATVVIMLGVYVANFTGKKSLDQLTDEERIAYNQAMEAFGMLSSNFNKGNESLAMMSHVSESLQMGNDQLNHLGEFDNTIDRFFKTNE